MSLAAIIKQAQMIQELAKHELSSKGCICSVINLEDLMEQLRMVAQTMHDELREKQEMLVQANASSVKLQQQLTRLKSENGQLHSFIRNSEDALAEIADRFEHLTQHNQQLETMLFESKLKCQAAESQLRHTTEEVDQLRCSMYQSEKPVSRSGVALIDQNKFTCGSSKSTDRPKVRCIAKTLMTLSKPGKGRQKENDV